MGSTFYVGSSVGSRNGFCDILLYFFCKKLPQKQLKTPAKSFDFTGHLAEKPGFEPGLPFLTLLP